jgi:Ni,Fe-hydrogenase III large subunit
VLKALFGDLTPVPNHHGARRVSVEAALWREIGMTLREGKLELLAEWGDVDQVHCALYEPATRLLNIASLSASASIPALAQFHAPALRLERAIVDMLGLRFTGLPDQRAWLDHGRWPIRHPLLQSSPPSSIPSPTASASAPDAPSASASRYPFLPAEGPSLHQIPVGPVHAGIIEPGHFRFTASGETVVRLEERLGYVHRGVEPLLRGNSIEHGAAIAARVSGDSTVAYSIVFARAIEQALEHQAPPRAHWLRAIMAELERIANHLGDIGAICNDASFALMHAECAILREATLRACALAFGHRLMMDRVLPGGVSIDLTAAGGEAILALIERLRVQFPELIELYENTASLQDRTVSTGTLSAALAAQFGAGGYVGRASGRAFDARTCLPYPPYDELPIPIALRAEGDVDARVWVRILEVQHSLRWLQAALAAIPSGANYLPLPTSGAAAPLEATTLVEGFRGDILASVRLDRTLAIERCHLRDPSWFQWPLLESAIAGNIVADFPLCNKSFNCSYAGHDL